MKKTANKIAKSSFILIFSTALTKVISAFFKIPLASGSFLGEVGFGYFSVAFDLYMPFYLLAITGLPTAVSHIIAEKASKDPQNSPLNTFYSCRRLFILLGSIISLALIIITLPLAILSGGKNNSFYGILAIIPSIFISFIISAYRGYFEGFSNMYPTAISKVIEAVFKLVLGLLFAFIGLKINKNVVLACVFAITAVTFATALSLLYLHFKFIKENTYKQTGKQNCEKGQLKQYLRRSLPFVFSGLTASVVALLDVFCVKIPLSFANESYISTAVLQSGEYLGDFSTLLYGIRSKAFTLYNLIPTFTATLGVGALPVLTALNAKGDRATLKQNVNYTLKLVSVVTFPAAIGLSVLGNQIMSLLYFNSSLLGGNLLRIYGISAIFAGFSIPLITVLQAIGKKRVTIINIAISIFIKIVSSLILVSFPEVNIYAAAFSNLICYLYLCSSAFLVLYKTIGGFDFKNPIFKPLFSAVLCGITALVVSSISQTDIVTVLSILFAVVVYIISIILTNTFSKCEVAQFPLVNKLFDKE